LAAVENDDDLLHWGFAREGQHISHRDALRISRCVGSHQIATEVVLCAVPCKEQQGDVSLVREQRLDLLE
jgi:hypothetical protein